MHVRSALLGTVAVVLLSAGTAAPCQALPGAIGSAATSFRQPLLLIPVRHHHHHGHWRWRSSRYPELEAAPPALPPEAGNNPLYRHPEAGSEETASSSSSLSDAGQPAADRPSSGSRAGVSAAPSIRWVDPPR